MLTIYGLGVPSQFILARMRLALFIPLLAFGLAGWLRWWESRRAADRDHNAQESNSAGELG